MASLTENNYQAPLNQRRLRKNQVTRSLLQDVHLSYKQFIQPYFVAPQTADHKSPLAVPGLTGTYRETPDSLLRRLVEDREKGGVQSCLLFAVPEKKIPARVGSSHLSSFDTDFTSSQIEAIRKEMGKDYFIAVDVCFCSHTDHGHCGILNEKGDAVVNDLTVSALAKAALSYAKAGADCVAPSDMMDGRIAAIRDILDKNGLDETLLMSYAVKFHSKFYGPFRLAADSAPKAGTEPVLIHDRATYQIDPANRRDARNCALRDVKEGADILMVKPGLPYIDVLSELSKEIQKPWAVYEVSGEYAAIELMNEKGLMNGQAAHVESWTALARAGAQIIISYGARYAKEWLK